MVIANAGHTASHNLHTIQRSSPALIYVMHALLENVYLSVLSQKDII